MRSRLLLLVAIGLFGTACDGYLSRQDEERVLAWLTCDECSDGELAFITDTLGMRARVPLRQPLLDTAMLRQYHAAAEVSARAAFRAYPSTAVDSTPFMNRFVSNYEARLQRRAILALAALGDTASLREAWNANQGGFAGYRPDVVELLDRSLGTVGAMGFTAATVDNIEVVPDNLPLTVLAKGSLEARVTDAAGNPTTGPLDWESRNLSVATVTDPSWGLGVVTAVATGSTWVVASSGVVSDSASVLVSPAPPPPPDFVILSGDGQRAPVSTQLPLPLEVELTLSGQPVSGIVVEWEFIRGGPSGVVATSITDALGVASYQPALGQTPGRIWIVARAAGQNVRFQIIATP